MSATTSLIRVPNEIADAIRRIASAEGVTIATLLTEFADQKHRAGVVERKVPNVSLTAIGMNIMFVIGDKNREAMPFDMLDADAARAIADIIDGVATSGVGKRIGTGEFEMVIGRRGRGIVFKQGDRHRTMAVSAIPSLTAWLREAADEAEEFEKAMHLT